MKTPAIFSKSSQLNIDPPKDRQSINDWVSKFTSELLKGKKGKFDVEKAKNDINYWETWKINFVVENFPADKIEYYVALQKKIAEIIPTEEFRPTILLRVRGKKAQGKPADSLLIGGVGPLSDAEISRSVVEESADKENLSFDLFSSPPNRGVSLSKVGRLGKYLGDLGKVIELSDAKKVFMLSNTYHIHVPMIQSFINHSNSSGMQIVDMVFEIGKIIKNYIDSNPQVSTNNVLILGTLEAAQKRLYPTILEGMGIKYTNVTTEDDLKKYEKEAKKGRKVEPTKQHKLQEIIDHVKSGRVNQKEYGDKTVGDELVDFVYEQIISSNSNYLILGCTELPLGLHAKPAGSKKTYLEILTERVQNAGKAMPKILDSEVEFSKIIRRENTKKVDIDPKVAEANKATYYHQVQAYIANGQCDEVLKGFLDAVSNISSDVENSKNLSKSEKDKVTLNINTLLKDIKRMDSSDFSKNAEKLINNMDKVEKQEPKIKVASNVFKAIWGVIKAMFAAITAKYGQGYEWDFKPKENKVVLDALLNRLCTLKKQELSTKVSANRAEHVDVVERSKAQQADSLGR